MSKKHSLKQLEGWARDWGMYKWMNADNPDKEADRPRKNNNNKPKTSGFKGKKPNNYNKKRK